MLKPFTSGVLRLVIGGMAMLLTAAAAPPLQILDPSSEVTLPDYSYAGYGFGDRAWPSSTAVVINVADHGAIANDANDDSRAVLAGLAAAHKVAGPVTLRFPAGRFIISEILWVKRSNIIIEGAGRGAKGTVLTFPRPLRLVDKTPTLDKLRAYLKRGDKRQVEPRQNINLPFSEYSWNGGFIWVAKPGATVSDDAAERDPPAGPGTEIIAGAGNDKRIRLAAGGNWRAGDIVQLQWLAKDGPTSSIIADIYGPGVTAGASHWSYPDRPLVTQTTRIAAITGNTATLATPLMHSVSATVPARLVHWDGLTDVGIRDLALDFPVDVSFGHHLEQGYNGIHFGDVFDGWIEGLRISNAESGILTYSSASVTIRDIIVDGSREAHYAVHVGDVHNLLVTRLLVANPVLHSLSFNTRSTRSVFQHVTVLQQPTLDQHAGSNHQNLFDDITVHVAARRDKNGNASYPLWDGSGAAYWQPGHGRYNTSWNIQISVESGAKPSETVVLTGLDEGPAARIVGIAGNRSFTVNYRPAPYIEGLNRDMRDVPSLYDWQFARRHLKR